MGSAEPPGDFDIHKFFRNPVTSGHNPSQYPPPGASFHDFSLANMFNVSSGSYTNLSASYPFGSQGSMYNYPSYSQDHGVHIPPYPVSGFSQPNLSSPVPESSSISALNQSVNSSSASPKPSLDSARLLALLTNQSSTKSVSAPIESHAFPETPGFFSQSISVEPSAPPMSLAPVSSSRRVANNKIPRGRNLQGDYIVYDVDTHFSGEEQPQLEASTITKYASDPQLCFDRRIAVNSTYICYGLRPNQHIRILNMNNALRNLLRGHSERITDMAFFAEDTHLLASASSDGRIFVRRIEEGRGEDNKAQIIDHILLALQLSGNWESVHPRVCWHAYSMDVIMVGIDKYVITIDIERVKQTAAPNGFVAEGPVLCDVDRPIEGVHCAINHEGEIVDISCCYVGRSLVASASKDGMVRLWADQSMTLCSTLVPHSRQPVCSVSFLSPSHRADHIVLVTAGPLNRELKLWVPSGEEGWLPTSGSIDWKCIQTLEFKSTLVGVPNDAFFNQVIVVSKASAILLANAKKNAIYVVHVDFGLNPASTKMDYLAEFSVALPILSITAITDNVRDGDGVLHVYCVQTQAIQQYSLDLSLCKPLSEAPSFTLEKNVHMKSAADTQAAAAAFEVSELLRVKSPGPISGVSASGKSGPDVGISEKEMNEKEQLSSIGVPSPNVEPVPSSPRVLPALLSMKSLKLSSPPGEQEYVRILESSAGESKDDSEMMGITEDIDWQVISTTSVPSVISEPHLVTPSELMSMVARSKREPEGRMQVPSSQGLDITPRDLIESGRKVESFFENVEIKEVTDDNLLCIDQSSMQNTLVTSDFRKEVEVVDQLHYQPGKESDMVSTEEPLSTESMLDGLSEQNQETSYKIDDSSTLSVEKSRKKKNKNKADSNISIVAMHPSETPTSSISILNTQVAAQISTIQDSLSQLVNQHKEFQKQIGNLIAVPLAKEVKRMEVSLGQRMDKLLKAHVDALTAQIQEENIRRENSEKQIAPIVSNILNKDLPEALERSTKKEFSTIGSSISRFITPNIEKATSIAIIETFQKGIADKAITQLEKSMGVKIEAIMEKQLQTQFQTFGKQALQDGLTFSLGKSIMPSFERACQEMIGQVDAAFQKGILEHQMHAQQQLVSSHSALTTALQESVASIASLATAMKDDLADGQKRLATVIENIVGSHGAYAVIPDKAMTVERVEESLDPTKELARLVSEGKIEEAFNKALSLTNVGIVSWLCNQVDLAALCTASPSPLSQGVLLSLVQQLGCDLGQDTGKKLTWIKDAALALNPHDPNLAPHMRLFLEQLYTNLHALANTQLTPDLANSTRLVIHLVNSLLSICK